MLISRDRAARGAGDVGYFGLVGCRDGYELPLIRDLIDSMAGEGSAQLAGTRAVRRSLIDESGYAPPKGGEPVYGITFMTYQTNGGIAELLDRMRGIEGVEKVVCWRMVGDGYSWELPKKGSGAD